MLSFHDALSIAGAFCACPRYSPATMIAQLTSQCMYTYVYIDECYIWSEVAQAAGSGTPAPELQCEWPPSHV